MTWKLVWESKKNTGWLPLKLHGWLLHSKDNVINIAKYNCWGRALTFLNSEIPVCTGLKGF